MSYIYAYTYVVYACVYTYTHTYIHAHKFTCMAMTSGLFSNDVNGISIEARME